MQVAEVPAETPVAPGVRPLSVVLVGSQQVLAAGVRHTLELDGVRVAPGCAEASVAAQVVVEQQPDLCLVLATDATDATDALAVVEAVRAVAPAVAVVVLSRDDADVEGDALLRAVSAGAAGWLSLDAAPETLGRTLRAAAAGEPALSRRHVGRLLEVLRRSHGRTLRLPDGRTVGLTAREHETLQQLARDTSTTGVAARLGVSESTARWHIAGLVRKLGATSRQDAVRLAGLAPTGRTASLGAADAAVPGQRTRSAAAP
ncbi:response regulator transcription factor [Angustibacter aerolatus]